MSPDYFDQCVRNPRQKQLIKRLGKEYIQAKQRELCDICVRFPGCQLIPTDEGCCYFTPMNPPVKPVATGPEPTEELDPEWDALIKEDKHAV